MPGQELHRLDARIDEMTGVDAELQSVVGGVGQHPFDLVLELDIAARVRVQHGRQTVIHGR